MPRLIAILLTISAWTLSAHVLPVSEAQADESHIDSVVRRLAPTCCDETICANPDDYCRKLLPSLYCLPCGQCDDYCRKPLPCVTCPPNGTHCDDYCRKPLPRYCRLNIIPRSCTKAETR
ncbi:MAG: hypothetical protein U0795_23045 [Pirellulales bacterium]